MARKSKYASYVKPYLKDITKWVKEGMYEYEIFERLGIGHTQWEDYKNKYEELPDAIKKGKQNLTRKLVLSLYKRANGFTNTETKRTVKKGDTKQKEVTRTVKYIPPSETAIIFALCNLDPENWKRHDKDDIRDKDVNINIKIEEDDD